MAQSVHFPVPATSIEMQFYPKCQLQLSCIQVTIIFLLNNQLTHTQKLMMKRRNLATFAPHPATILTDFVHALNIKRTKEQEIYYKMRVYKLTRFSLVTHFCCQSIPFFNLNAKIKSVL